MPRSRGEPANRDALAEWEREAFTVLRAHRDATTPTDDLLADDPLADRELFRSTLERLDRA